MQVSHALLEEHRNKGPVEIILLREYGLCDCIWRWKVGRGVNKLIRLCASFSDRTNSMTSLVSLVSFSSSKCECKLK